MTGLLKLVPILLVLPLLPASGCRPVVEDSLRGDHSTTPDADTASQAGVDNDEELRARIDAALTYTYQNRTLNLRDNAAWQILHGVLTYGTKYRVLNEGEPVDAVQWVLDGNPMTGWVARPGTPDVDLKLLGDSTTTAAADGRQGMILVMEPGTKTGQGHPDQWLAILSQCELPSDTKMILEGQEYELGDVIRQAMWDVHDGKECSWTLISFTKYLPLDYQWYASDGQLWNIEKIIQMEAEQDVNNSACGGSHRLIGMTMALQRYRASLDDPQAEVTGGWLAAEKKINDAVRTARQFQNPDGSFSTNYFSRPARSPELSLQINTTGHTLEFLALTLTKEQLGEAWVEKAALRLCDLFDQTRNLPLECGTLYHAAHGLIEYRDKRWGPWTFPDAAE